MKTFPLVLVFMHINALALQFKIKGLWIKSLPWWCWTERTSVVSFAMGPQGVSWMSNILPFVQLTKVLAYSRVHIIQ